MINFTRSMLVEYGLSIPPLAVEFELNPETLTRTRNVTVSAGQQGCMDFISPAESRRVAQSAKAGAETLSFKVLLDATDRIADNAHPLHKTAGLNGIQPEISVLRSMLEPRVNGPAGFQLMAKLRLGQQRAHDRDTHLAVLLFIWGTHVLPVFMTNLTITEKAHLSSLIPYRAEVDITLQVIESMNPFYTAEQIRHAVSSAKNLVNQTMRF